MSDIKIFRVYEYEKIPKGKKVLIDRLWPRGIKKEKLEDFYWAKEITPSSQIRKKFNHKKENFTQFKNSYLEELENNENKEIFIKKIKEYLKKDDVILLFGARDKKINHAVVLKEWLEKNL